MRVGASKTISENRSNNENGFNREKSTKKQIIFMIIWFLIFLFLLFEVIKLINYTLGKYDKENMWLYNSINSIVQKIYIKENLAQTEEKKVSLAALGNIYLTPNITKGSKDVEGYNFTNGLEDIQKKLKEFDFVVANLSTPIADKSLGYSTAKSYNAPEELITTLKDLNISAVSTATYHIYDKKDKGITGTIDNLTAASINQTGISNNEKIEPIILSKNDINIGILSYTNDSNIEISSSSGSVNILEEEKLKQDIKYLKEKNVDIIIAYLNEYSKETTVIDSKLKNDADLLFDNGVNIVFGGDIAAVHDNYEDEITIESDTKQKSHLYVIYSLGDFMGGYLDEYGSATIIPSFEITKTIIKNNKGEISNTRVDFKANKPIFTWTSVDKNYSKTMYIMEDEISNFNNDNSNLTAKEYKQMKEEYTRILKLYE